MGIERAGEGRREGVTYSQDHVLCGAQGHLRCDSGGELQKWTEVLSKSVFQSHRQIPPFHTALKRETHASVDAFPGWCKALGRTVLPFANEEPEAGEGKMSVCLTVHGRAKTHTSEGVGVRVQVLAEGSESQVPGQPLHLSLWS